MTNKDWKLTEGEYWLNSFYSVSGNDSLFPIKTELNILCY